MSNVFGLLVTGRMVQTNCEQISETHFLFPVPDVASVNHVVVFLTGSTPFPNGMGGAVYFTWPSADGPAWHLLGFISNEKPSAIFKIAQLKQTGALTSSTFGNNTLTNQMGQPNIAQIGISVEPLTQLGAQTPALNTQPSSVATFVEFTQKMLENFVNYASSFGITQQQMMPEPNKTFVPFSVVQQWYENFQRRMQQNPEFWKT